MSKLKAKQLPSNQKTLLDVWKIPVSFSAVIKKEAKDIDQNVVDRKEFENDYWKVIPEVFSVKEDGFSFDDLLKELQPMVVQYYHTLKGKTFSSRRLSCKFSELEEKEKIAESTRKVKSLFTYDNVKWYNWNESRLVSMIRDKLAKIFGVRFNYCLASLYRNGHDVINYHSDYEALNTVIVSVSFGATRKFRFRRKKNNDDEEKDLSLKKKSKGFDYEYLLSNGDVVLMKVGCQNEYEHCVPQESSIEDPRINLTFRMFE
jgi:alkylated DNA repair dioxygenase AlkB